jgi:hypothetical protein
LPRFFWALAVLVPARVPESLASLADFINMFIMLLRLYGDRR